MPSGRHGRHTARAPAGWILAALVLALAALPAPGAQAVAFTGGSCDLAPRSGALAEGPTTPKDLFAPRDRKSVV